ncbi:hypothetical protein CIPAW_03G216900 [Carya illinoinensis]|uniref:Uncharacterized protein n=2 Tax=Carya illinoinensis TaxID=32201 RepID=A0A8T1R3Q8_CARIL|nr:hypothetical protein CIPAW_03G216900 [Carya illinoinensis]
MPGNILVSVQEFIGLPSSSPSSPIRLKVSMGKIEYQTSDKEEFSFPLTTLRDNLIVTLLDADGKEISRAGVETNSIVERGFWDDLFPLEGGGHLRMKLQFVLSEEERNRIRMMNDADQYEELLSAMPASQGVDIHLTEVSYREPVEENESKTLPAEYPTRAICFDGVLSVESGLDIAATSNSISHDLEETMSHSHQKRTQPRKTRSNVRKMISAFESSLSQDMQSQVKPPPTEFQSEELKHGPTYIRKREEQISLLGHKSSQESWQLEELNNKKFQIIGTMPNLENEFKAVHKEVDKEEEKSHQDSMQTSTSETPTVSGRMLDEHSGASRHRLESVEYNVKKHSLFESSGVWIFPVEARRLCVTTGGTKMIDLMGGYSMEPEVHQGKLNLSMGDNVEEHSVDAGIAVKVNKDEKTCHKIRNSKHEKSENIETSGGPVGQVVKVAIMIGFGLLVLLTSQKNNR